MNLSRLVRDFPAVPTVAFTATATVQVQDDIVSRLGLRQPFTVRASFDRPNLFYGVTPKTSVEAQILEFVKRRPEEPGIVYRFTRKSVEETCDHLVASGVNALPYHAGMEGRDRAANQEAFRRDEAQVVVATIAFGMGIDKPNVRWIVHGDLPKNVESYYQETGRAGRDGDPAFCQLFFSAGDAARIEFFIGQCEDEGEQKRLRRLLRAMLNFAGTNSCRRKRLLGYFGEQYGKQECGRCDVCQGDVETVDATTDAQKLMSAIVRSGQRFGVGHVVDIVAGANTDGMRRSGHDQLPTYGVGSDQPKKHWFRVADELICQQCVERPGEKYPTLSVTKKGWAVLTQGQVFKMLKPADRKTRSRSSAVDPGPSDPQLFEELRAWRREQAELMGIPPYVIFGDRTLRQISAAKPAGREELAALHGVGEHKLAKFGDHVLKLVRDYVAENPGSEPVDAKVARPSGTGRPASGTYATTWQLFGEGLSAEEIADRRGLAVTTILGHLEKGHSLGKDIDLSRLVDSALLARIDAIMDEVGHDKLAPVVERGDGAFGYGEARIARLLRRKANQT
jgi:ATP-dependent DNA helicase RecQ